MVPRTCLRTCTLILSVHFHALLAATKSTDQRDHRPAATSQTCKAMTRQLPYFRVLGTGDGHHHRRAPRTSAACLAGDAHVPAQADR